MRPHHLFFSILTLVLIIFLFSLTILSAGAYFAQGLRFSIVDIVQNSPMIFLYIAVIFFILALSFLIGFTSLQKNRFLKIKIKPFAYSINPSILSYSIQDIIRKHLKNRDVSVEVILLPTKKLEVISYLPDIEEDIKEGFLDWAKKESIFSFTKKISLF